MAEKEQISMFDDLDEYTSWKPEWKNMPEFVQEDLQPVQQIIVSFETREDVKKFSELIGQRLTYKTKSVWFPEIKKDKPSEFVYAQTIEKCHWCQSNAVKEDRRLINGELITIKACEVCVNEDLHTLINKNI